MQRAALTAKSTINSSPADTLTSVTVEQHQACGWTEVKAWVNLRNDRQLQYKWSKSAANYDKMQSWSLEEMILQVNFIEEDLFPDSLQFALCVRVML